MPIQGCDYKVYTKPYMPSCSLRDPSHLAKPGFKGSNIWSDLTLAKPGQAPYSKFAYLDCNLNRLTVDVVGGEKARTINTQRTIPD